MQLMEQRVPGSGRHRSVRPGLLLRRAPELDQEHFANLDVIVVTAFGSIDCVVKTIKMGALNYVMKP